MEVAESKKSMKNLFLKEQSRAEAAVQCSGTMYNTTDAGSKVINDFRNQISSIVVVAHASADRQTHTV